MRRHHVRGVDFGRAAAPGKRVAGVAERTRPRPQQLRREQREPQGELQPKGAEAGGIQGQRSWMQASPRATREPGSGTPATWGAEEDETGEDDD